MGYETKGKLLENEEAGSVSHLEINDQFYNVGEKITLNSGAEFIMKRDGSFEVSHNDFKENSPPDIIKVFVTAPHAEGSYVTTLTFSYEEEKMQEENFEWDAIESRTSKTIETESGITIIISAENEEPKPRRNKP